MWGHHLNQRLSENHAGPFVFGATLGLHFAGNFVIKGVGVKTVTYLLASYLALTFFSCKAQCINQGKLDYKI